MVGKPNLPVDAEERTDVHGAASPTPGLSPLDEEREASMADEGGASGMAAESQDSSELMEDEEETEEPLLWLEGWLLGGVFLAGTAAGLLLSLVMRRR